MSHNEGGTVESASAALKKSLRTAKDASEGEVEQCCVCVLYRYVFDDQKHAGNADIVAAAIQERHPPPDCQALVDCGENRPMLTKLLILRYIDQNLILIPAEKTPNYSTKSNKRESQSTKKRRATGASSTTHQGGILRVDAQQFTRPGDRERVRLGRAVFHADARLEQTSQPGRIVSTQIRQSCTRCASKNGHSALCADVHTYKRSATLEYYDTVVYSP